MSKETRYNRWASQHVWDHREIPELFHGKQYPIETEEFAEAVFKWQKAKGITADGMLGPSTFSAMVEHYYRSSLSTNSVILDGEEYPFPGKVIQRPGMKSSRRREDIRQVVLHVDTTWDTETAAKILKRRGLSSHFGVDGDRGQDGYATLYQWADPCQRFTYHAGEANKRSIGIDANNPLAMKYQKRDERRRGRKRKVVDATIFGKPRRNLCFFPEQVATLVAMAELFERVLEIPRAWPRHDDGTPITDHLEDEEGNNVGHLWHGWTGHHHQKTTHYCPGAAGVVIVDELCPLPQQKFDEKVEKQFLNGEPGAFVDD